MTRVIGATIRMAAPRQFAYREAVQSSGRRTMIAAILVAVASAIVHASALRGWWLYDDPQLILFAIRVSPFETFFTPAKYQLLATHTFTPLLPLSLLLDLELAGLTPEFFYAHQVVSLTIGAVLFFFVLRRYTTNAIAACAAIGFVSSWPALYAARTLMIRHYVEGFVFAAAALLLFIRRKRAESDRRRIILDLLASFFYFLALLEKEVYAPLPVFLALISRADGDPPKRTIRRLMPPAMAFVVAYLWRTSMIGARGGFAPPSLHDLAILPRLVVEYLVGPSALYASIAAGAIAIVVVAAATFRRPAASIVVAIVAIVAALAPLITLASNFEWRFDFAVAVIVSGCVALAAFHGFTRQSLAPALLVGAAAAILLASSFSKVAAYDRLTEEARSEGRYLWSEPADAPMLLASTTSWYLTGIADLRAWSHRGATPPYASSLLPLTLGEVQPKRVVTWNGAARRFSPIVNLDEQIAGERKRRLEASPFAVSIARDDHTLSWTFDAPSAAEWRFVAVPPYAEYPLTASGSRLAPEPYGDQYFRVRLIRVDGTWDITPVLRMPRAGGRTTWKR